MLVVIHQDDRVRSAAKKSIIKTVVPRRQRHHDFQIQRMQAHRQFRDEAAEVRLGLGGNFLEVHDDARLPRVHAVRGKLAHQLGPRCGAVQHRRHFSGVPHHSIGVVDHGHGGDFHAGLLHLLHPRGELHVGNDAQFSVWRKRVERFRNQQIEMAIVLLQRRQAGGIPAHVKCRLERLVIVRHFAERSHAALAARAHQLGLHRVAGRLHRVQPGLALRLKKSAQIHGQHHADQKSNQQHGAHDTAQVQGVAGAAPAALLLVIENRLAMRHGLSPS